MTCHQNIARAYDTTGMHRSFHRPTSADTIEDYKTHNTLYNKASGLYYTMLERDGKFYQRRYEIGFDGKETNVVEKQVDTSSAPEIMCELICTAEPTADSSRCP